MRRSSRIDQRPRAAAGSAERSFASIEGAEVKRTAREGPTCSRRPADAALWGCGTGISTRGLIAKPLGRWDRTLRLRWCGSSDGPGRSHQVKAGPDEKRLLAPAPHHLSNAHRDVQVAPPRMIFVTVCISRGHEYGFRLGFRRARPRYRRQSAMLSRAARSSGWVNQRPPRWPRDQRTSARRRASPPGRIKSTSVPGSSPRS